MIELSGSYSDGKTSRQAAATLQVQPSGAYRLMLGDTIRRGHIRELDISPRVGGIPRRLTFAAGEVLTTNDNDAVDHLFRRCGGNRLYAALHWLENHWGAVIGLTGLTVLCVCLYTVYGIPAVARSLAHAIPVSLLKTTDKQALAVLDRLHFKDSALDESRRNSLREHLLAATPSLDPPVTIVFRGGGALGANAFALPGGTVVFTDQLVELASEREQIMAVYAHELGHLVHRHSLRRITQNSLAATTALLIAGDPGATTGLLGAIPFALTDLAWSREFEREADDYALEFLRARELAPRHFVNMMKRLQCSQHSQGADESSPETFRECLDSKFWREDAGKDWSFYLFSHPPAAARIRRFLD